MQTHTQTITRYDSSDSQYDPNTGQYSVEVVGTTFDIKCSVQPFRNGKNQIELPEGVTSNDTIVIYTDEANILQTADQFGKGRADTTEYRGRVYECFYVEYWGGYGLITDNVKAIFIRRDQEVV